MAIEQIAPLDGYSLIALAVPARAKVLVVRSPAAEAVDARLAERGCAVTHVGSLAEAADAEFDAVVLADGFELLADPVAALVDATKLLASGGSLVFAADNATSVRARTRAFFGAATDAVGLPVRVYDLAALHLVVQRADLGVVDTLRVFEAKPAAGDAQLPPALVELALHAPDAHTDAFVIVAARAVDGAASSPTLAESLQAQVDAATRQAAATEAASAALEAERDTLTERIGALEADVSAAQAQTDAVRTELAAREASLVERIEMIDRLQIEQRHLELDIAVKNDYIADLRTEAQRWKDIHDDLRFHFDELVRSRPYRLGLLLHRILGRIPFVRSATRRVMPLVRRNR